MQEKHQVCVMLLAHSLVQLGGAFVPPQQVFATSGPFNLPVTKVSSACLLDQTEKPLSQPGLESFSPSHSLALHQRGCSLGNKESALLFR